MNVSIRHFKAFLAVADNGSFTRAAHQMHISQPGLSSMMQEMESQLSCRLFDRTTRSVVLTAAGHRLLPSARHIVEEFDGLTPALKELSIEQRRVLKVAATPIFTASVLPHVYMQLKHTHPELELKITDVRRPEVERMVRNGDVDCGLGIFETPLPELLHRPLFAFDFVYCEALHSPIVFTGQLKPKQIRWAELPAVPFIELAGPSEVQRIIDRCWADAGVPHISEGIALNNIETLIGMAAAGAGPTILPSFACGIAAQSGVVTALLVEPVLTSHFHLITRSGKAQPAVLDSFVETLAQVMQERGESIRTRLPEASA